MIARVQNALFINHLHLYSHIFLTQQFFVEITFIIKFFGVALKVKPPFQSNGDMTMS